LLELSNKGVKNGGHNKIEKLALLLYHSHPGFRFVA